MKKIISGILAACILSGCATGTSSGINNETVSNNTVEEKSVSTTETEIEISSTLALDIRTALNGLLSAVASGDRSYEKSELESLENADKGQYRAWEQIVEYWKKTNEEGFVNPGILPDGLPSDNSFCIVVLGYQLNSDGSMREELIGRLETAKKCAEKYPESYVLLTGGGTASLSDNTEADCMAQWLLEKGIDSKRIIVENKSLTSSENAVYSYEIMKKEYPEISSVAIVTSDYHVALGCQLFYAQLKMGECIHGDNEIRVISNAAYISGSSSSFSLSSQAAWLMNLFNKNN